MPFEKKMRNLNRKLSFVFALLFNVSMLAGCAAPAAAPTAEPTAAPTAAPTAVPTEEPTAAPIVVTDALGRTVEFAELPQKIVIAGKGIPLIAKSAFLFPEAQDRVISYEFHLQMKDRNFIKTIFTKTENLPLLEKEDGAEQIAPFNPDLVIYKSVLYKG